MTILSNSLHAFEGQWTTLVYNQSYRQLRWANRDDYTYVPGFAKVVLHSVSRNFDCYARLREGIQSK